MIGESGLKRLVKLYKTSVSKWPRHSGRSDWEIETGQNKTQNRLLKKDTVIFGLRIHIV